MRRLYFLSPDWDSCHALVVDLEEAGIEEKYIHVIAKDTVPLDGLPKATVFQRSDLVYGVEWGVGVGGTAGALGGLLAVTFPPAGLVLGGGAVLLTALTGATLGGLVSAMVSKDVPNHDLEQYEKAIFAGQFLVMVDVPKELVGSYCELIRNHHPEAEIGISHPPKERFWPMKQAS